MRGTIAKKIRSKVYRTDLSHRIKEYVKGHEPRFGFQYGVPPCICKGNRRAYQLTKALYLASRRG